MNIAFRAAVIGGIMFGCTPDDTEHRRADNSPSLIDQRSWAALGLAKQLGQFPQTKTSRIWTVQADETVLVCGEGTPRFVAKGTVPDPKGGSDFRLLTVENVWSRFCDNPPVEGLALSSSKFLKKDNPSWGSFKVMGSGFPKQKCAENEEANELLAGEMSHRVMNLLHIATSLTQITSRSAVTKEDMALELTNRLMALGRAQELVRPTPGRKMTGPYLEISSLFCWPRTTRRGLAFAFACRCPR